MKYVYPIRPGAMVRGIGSGHSSPPLSNEIISEEKFVWPSAKGNIRGQAIEPLHPKTPEACIRDNKYYEFMTLVDAIRVGKTREQNIAFKMIKERLENA